MHVGILVAGGYGLGNFGDDALMVALNEYLRSAVSEKQFAFYCDAAPYLKSLIGEAAVMDRRGRSSVTCDLLVYGGGTQFYSFPRTRARYLPSLSWQRVRRGADPRMLVEAVARRLRRFDPMSAIRYRAAIGVGIGVGPFVAGSLEKRRADNALRAMSHCIVRDARSYAYAMDIRGGEGCALGTDLCYTPAFVERIARARRSGEMTRRIGIIVRDWTHTEQGRAYYSPLLQASAELVKRGYGVDYFLFSEPAEQEWAKLLARETYSVRTWRPDEHTLGDFARAVGECDLVITARFHGAVFATLLGVPCICIEVEQKLEIAREQYQSLKRWGYPFRAEDLVSDVEDRFSRYATEAAGVREDLRRHAALGAQMSESFGMLLREQPGRLGA